MNGAGSEGLGERLGEESSSRARGALPIVIAELTRHACDMDAINEIARESLHEPGFSVDRELERPWARVWAALEGEAEGTPVGFLVTWHVADELHILNIATAKEARRRGIGAALMEIALAYATGHGVRLLLLEVRRSNEDARRLYRRFGFVDTGIRRGYYADNGEDAIEMMRDLEG